MKNRICLLLCILGSVWWGTLYAEDTNDMNQTVNENENLSLGLDETVSYAVKNNYDLKKIQAQSFINWLQVVEKYRNLFPSLKISYLQNVDTVQEGADSRQNQISLDSDVTIYDGGKARLDYDIVKLQAGLAKNDYKIAYSQFVAKVREQYFKTIQLKKAIEINKQTLMQGQQQLEFIKKENELGEATSIEVMEIGAQVHQIEIKLKQSEDDYENSLQSLRLILKLDWRQKLNLKGDIEQSFVFKQISSEPSVDDLVSLALKNRKETLSSDIECQIDEKKYEMSKNYYIPNFILGLNYNLSGVSDMPREKGWGVCLKVSSALLGNTADGNMGYTESGNGGTHTISNNANVNVLNNMEYKRNIYSSKVAVQAAIDDKTTTSQKIASDVITNYQSLKSAWDIIGLSRSQVELSDAEFVNRVVA